MRAFNNEDMLKRKNPPTSGESVKEGVIPHVPSYKQWHRKPLLACGAMHYCDRIRAINLNLANSYSIKIEKWNDYYDKNRNLCKR